MTAALKLKQESLFQVLTKIEIDSILRDLITSPVSFIGQCDDSSMVIVKPLIGTNSKKIIGEIRFITRVQFPQAVIFNFVYINNKYFFKAVLESKNEGQLAIVPSSNFYIIQRRESSRLMIPKDYHAVFKMTHIDGRPVRSFAKITDLSVGGIGLEVRTSEVQIQNKQKIRGVMTFSRRPPEDIEIEVRHINVNDDNNQFIQAFGGQFRSQTATTISRKMKSIMGDIQRELFKEFDQLKK